MSSIGQPSCCHEEVRGASPPAGRLLLPRGGHGMPSREVKDGCHRRSAARKLHAHRTADHTGPLHRGEDAAGGSGRFGDVYDPATGELARRVAFANVEEVDAAVRAARVAFGTWSETPPVRRAA